MKKYIGTGAWGIIIPNVYGATGGQSSAEYALSVTKYPPQGIRRAGAERATGYLARFSEYVKVANNLMLTVLMMETPEAADDIEEWVKLPGLDVVHMGLLRSTRGWMPSLHNLQLVACMTKSANV